MTASRFWTGAVRLFGLWCLLVLPVLLGVFVWYAVSHGAWSMLLWQPGLIVGWVLALQIWRDSYDG